METERRAFLEAIEKDRYDKELRLVFADWLEERGEDDEAVEQRRRATEEWKEADQWMYEFAKEVGLTYEECIQAGYDLGLSTGSNFDPENYDYPDRYWTNWEMITGKEVDEDYKIDMPFSCSC
jgi:uncharacterized protein (TIGR02996 family)